MKPDPVGRIAMKLHKAMIVLLTASFGTWQVIGLDTARAEDGGEKPAKAEAAARKSTDPRAGDTDHERSQRLLMAIDGILRQAAEERSNSRALPSKEKFILPPLWTQTREDSESRVRQLLDSALEIVTDAPVVRMQKDVAKRRATIAKLQDEITKLKERKLSAPEDGLLPGVLSETKKSIDSDIAELETRIKANREEIKRIKAAIHAALDASGVKMSPEQLDLLLDSVLGNDLLKLVTAFEAAHAIDERLGELLTQSSENIKAARRYFAMHAALFAMLLHAQDTLIDKIDNVYLAKLKAILNDIRKTRQETYRLLAGDNRPDQQRALRANLKSQEFAEKVASFYRDYLKTQRRQLKQARQRTERDLRIADNTFETVEASFQLRSLMEDARASFEALQRLEAPGFDQVFRNETLREEFKSLTEKIGPTS